MNLSITKRQEDLLSIVYNYIKDTGYPPTFEEMKDRLRVASNQSVIDLLDKLEKRKVLKRSKSIARSIAILPLGYEVLGKPPLVPFLGISHAGSPIEAIQVDGDWQQVSSDAAILKDKVFLLKISGDSMINAGIDDGDIVLVKSQEEFVSGDIVLAQINEESTIKRFISDNKPPFIYLKPENPKYTLIPFTEEVRLKGKVISILKNSQWRPISR